MKKNSSQQLWAEGEVESLRNDNNGLISLRNNPTYANVVEPLLNGCLTGQTYALTKFGNGLIDIHIAEIMGCPNIKKRLHDIKTANIKHLKLNLLMGVAHTTASLGVFEILTKKIRTINHGSPLSLYQEACCGLTSGATAAFVWRPFSLACRRMAPQINFSYRNMFSTLSHIVRDEGIFTLWKGSGLYMGTQMAAHMGMLASYNRSLNYLRDSELLPKWSAQISAGIISGFFAAACSHPCIYVKAIKETVLEKYHGGEKHAYRDIPLCISHILTPNSGCRFYVEFLNHFGGWARFCVVQWWIFEHFRSVPR